MVFCEVADGEADDAPQIAHFLGGKHMVKPELEAPENYCGGQAHDGVENEGPAIVRHIAGTKAEYVAFIQDIFDAESNSGSNDDRKQDIVTTTVSSNG